MLVYVCELCGYEYDSRIGDAANGIEENTDFEDLPSNWVCPLCGATKDDFIEEVRDEDDQDLI